MKIIPSEEENKYIKAKKHVDEIKGFYSHLLISVLIIPFLIFINYSTSWGFQWFWFPIGGIGISIIIHAFAVFGYGKDWEERKMKELMENDKF